MLAVHPQPIPQRTHIAVHVEEHHPPADVELSELGNVEDAVEPFAKLISRSGRSVRLYCTLPTGIPSCDTFIDAQDMQDLRARSLVFVHSLMESLRSRGISASYRLQPSGSPLGVVCALPVGLDANKVKAAAEQAVAHTQLQLRQKALLADLGDGLALVIT